MQFINSKAQNAQNFSEGDFSMKNIFRTVLVVLALSLVLTALAGCELKDLFGGENCKHIGGKATCREQAVCILCGEPYGELAEHKLVVQEAVAPTCTEDGITEGSYCSVCENTIVPQKVVEALGHNWLDGKCTVCQHECEHENTKKLPKVDPTCEDTGLTEGLKCTICGKVVVEQDEIEASGHHFAYGYCPDCGAEDPDFTGNEFPFDATKDVVLGTADKDPIAEGTLYAGKFYTIIGNVTQRTDDAVTKVKSIEVGKAFGGAVQIVVPDGKVATVVVKFASTGKSNTSLVGIMNKAGDLMPENNGQTTVTGTGGTELTYTLQPGVYKIGSPLSADYDRSARIISISTTLEDIVIPTEDGKTTVYFAVGADSALLKSFNGYYLTGGLTGWASGKSAIKLTRLGSTNIYYFITDADIDPSNNEYKIIIGTDNDGLKWNAAWTSTSSANSGKDNCKFEYTEGAQILNLGVHNFAAQPSVDTFLGWSVIGHFENTELYREWTGDMELLATGNENEYATDWIEIDAAKDNFKFRYDFGWSQEVGNAQGGNITFEEDGTYRIIFNTETKAYTLEKKPAPETDNSTEE